MRHPPYSTHLAPSDYHLFPNLKKNTYVDRDFRPMMSSSLQPKSGGRGSRKCSILPALKNSEIVTNCALTKAVTMLKNKCMLIRLPFI